MKKSTKWKVHVVSTCIGFFSADPSSKSFRKLGLKVTQGRDFEVEVVRGVLHPFPEHWTLHPDSLERLHKFQGSGGVKVLIINVQLKETMEGLTEVSALGLKLDRFSKNHEATAMREIAEELAHTCVKLNVNVLANQKVICPEIQEVFRQKGVFAIERLGRLSAKELEFLSKVFYTQNSV